MKINLFKLIKRLKKKIFKIFYLIFKLKFISYQVILKLFNFFDNNISIFKFKILSF
jgi:hypothetical protein